MDFPTVQAALDDLPPTFTRSDQGFQQWVDSQTAALARVTVAADAIASMIISVENAQYGWLDFWGLLFGIPRNINEANSTYLARIQFTLQNGAGPPLSIHNWIELVWAVAAVVVDSPTTLGYSITFPPVVTPNQIQQIVAGLGRIRPAGVPFSTFLQNTGTYLDTVNFLDCPRITSAYLGGAGVTQIYTTIPASTPNIAPLLPTLFMTDPTLNPSP